MPVPQPQRLYLKIPSEEAPEYTVVKAILEMFPGTTPTVLFFADTRIRRGTTCAVEESMLNELRGLLGDDAVVLK